MISYTCKSEICVKKYLSSIRNLQVNVFRTTDLTNDKYVFVHSPHAFEVKCKQQFLFLFRSFLKSNSHLNENPRNWRSTVKKCVSTVNLTVVQFKKDKERTENISEELENSTVEEERDVA